MFCKFLVGDLVYFGEYDVRLYCYMVVNDYYE